MSRAPCSKPVENKMKLKCIGGLANGKIVDVDSYYREHDQIQVMGTVEFRIANFEEDLKAFRENRTPESMTVPYHYYKIAVLHFPDKTELRFLIPVACPAKDALCFVLGA